MAGKSDRYFQVPDWAFLVKDCDTGRLLLWDYGLSGDADEFTPFVRQNLLEELQPCSPRKSVAEQIAEKDEKQLSAKGLGTIIFSHAHWDHCRPFWKDFPIAKAFFGPGTLAHCTPGHLENPSSQWDGRIFDEDEGLRRCQELAGPWVQFGPFERAMDFFGNGSFWVIQAPGHMPGNLIAAARLRIGTWVVMAGDCCHARQIYDGLHDFAVFKLPGGQTGCLQEDVSTARSTLGKIKAFTDNYLATVCFAHDATWMQKGSEDEVLLSLTNQNVLEAYRS
ncbi:uncharacterized protein HMPREF1541_05263 [Cyphellophora europaea CBS 101466]|uniref:Metallo-beta-lactamase domain-containing protein n=1 Tax=Cyphellophora europaea (strain CBS 101466) TaxID=1220924 RepID=W2RYY6_CYPE1|nr:uncharacterized protein HMPREF1541_05263 [Cyphellophora europaea CBS 101466]ETN40983.1 hypothetical protein HMPREF1541_05263 [Cyphellophora europaea CBS 101466]